MAFGTRCTECGWQEGDHFYEGEACEPPHETDKKRPGFRVSLEFCPRFKTNDIDLEFMEIRRTVRCGEFRDANDVWFATTTALKGLPFTDDVADRLKAHYLQLQSKTKPA